MGGGGDGGGGYDAGAPEVLDCQRGRSRAVTACSGPCAGARTPRRRRRRCGRRTCGCPTATWARERGGWGRKAGGRGEGEFGRAGGGGRGAEASSAFEKMPREEVGRGGGVSRAVRCIAQERSRNAGGKRAPDGRGIATLSRLFAKHRRKKLGYLQEWRKKQVLARRRRDGWESDDEQSYLPARSRVHFVDELHPDNCRSKRKLTPGLCLARCISLLCI